MSDRARIACAVERSESSRHAVEAARWLAGELDASVVVVHAFDEWAVGMPASAELAAVSVTVTDVVEAARQDAQGVLQDASAALAGVDHTVELVEAAPVEGVLRAVRDQEASVLVTGTAARVGLDRILLGSVAGELAERSPVPLMAVPAGVPLGRPGPVLAVEDGSGRAAGEDLAARMGRELVVVDIEGAEADAVESVTRAANSHDAALVVARTRGGGPLAALLGSVSAKLVRSVGRPVVLAPVTAPRVRGGSRPA